MNKYLTRDYLRKLDPRIYEIAAKGIEEGERFACLAIRLFAGRSLQRDVHLNAFDAAFNPEDSPGEGHFWNGEKNNNNQQLRVMALLTMAAMVRTAKASRGKKKLKIGPLVKGWPFPV